MAVMQEARTDVQWSPKPGPELRKQLAKSTGSIERTRGSFMPIVWISQAGVGGPPTLKVLFPSTIAKEKKVWVGSVLALPGCVTQADSFEEAKESLASALKDVFRLHRKRGTAPAFCEPIDDVNPSSIVNIHVDVEGT
jgi:predicted RNase H-like HicB family nuclease